MSRQLAGDLAFAPPRRIAKRQEELLRRHIGHCLRHSPYYRRHLAGLRSRLARLRLADLPGLPLTDKAAFGAHNAEFLAVPMERVVDISQSSGTTGEPTDVLYTERDLRRLARNERFAFALCGIGAGDVALLTCTLDRGFIAGLAYFLGLRAVGAATVRAGNAPLESQARVVRRLRPSVLVGVPSFMRKLGQFLAGEGVAPDSVGVRRIVGIGEPLRDRHLRSLKLDEDLTALWRAATFSTYAASETVTTCCECEARQGGHWDPELALVEIVDDGGQPLPAGEVGEVVVTPFQTEGMPLLRFRTGDLSFLIEEPCSCGRATPRLGPILGRKAQMLKIRGTTVYPPAIHSALDEVPGIRDYFIRVRAEADLSDRVEVHVSVSDPACTAESIGRRLQARLRVRPEIVVEPADAVARAVFNPASRKPVRFVDERGRRPAEADKR
jgi:phenylacetate-CoA ligase